MTRARGHDDAPGGRIKRAIDLGLAGLALLPATPLLGLCALAIVLDDGRPVIHRRRVLGLGGTEFDAFKLRTMWVDADGWLAAHPERAAEYAVQVKLAADPRVTRVGRFLRMFSLDELPQLWNVVLGEMSLVGPRMIHPSELDNYGSFGAARLSVKPGVTGLWQVSGRHNLTYQARVELDRQYVRDRSTWLDLKLLVRTVPAVLGRRGAL